MRPHVVVRVPSMTGRSVYRQAAGGPEWFMLDGVGVPDHMNKCVCSQVHCHGVSTRGMGHWWSMKAMVVVWTRLLSFKVGSHSFIYLYVVSLCVVNNQIYANSNNFNTANRKDFP